MRQRTIIWIAFAVFIIMSGVVLTKYIVREYFPSDETTILPHQVIDKEALIALLKTQNIPFSLLSEKPCLFLFCNQELSDDQNKALNLLSPHTTLIAVILGGSNRDVIQKLTQSGVFFTRIIVVNTPTFPDYFHIRRVPELILMYKNIVRRHRWSESISEETVTKWILPAVTKIVQYSAEVKNSD